MPQIPKMRKNALPWYLLDDTNGILITSATIPVSISDSKEIVWAATDIPGLNYTPLYPNRNGNSTISFQIPIINRKGQLGNSNLMQSFETLRNNDTPSLTNLFARGAQFTPNPSVIYQWGTHRGPQRFKITKLDFEHNAILTNKTGKSQYTLIDIEMVLDEQSSLYRSDRILRKVQGIMGVADSVSQIFGSSRPY
ncbi:hypothetical protein EHQ53_13985 [Leptospira langatensis]|uniref:Uncharacterized protein n=1 Tax=Leptospira langatensis TaxID=2484983 RepID=A0ABY2M964_9LEPT|nr:hypothetical protein [Leptospira langatensis]TGL39627.1 hypothetical protein EHQ53_13985 [Leptospira langatensis]